MKQRPRINTRLYGCLVAIITLILGVNQVFFRNHTFSAMERIIRMKNDKITCIWHAFVGLGDESTCKCPTRLLMIFTQNLAVSLHVSSLNPELLLAKFCDSAEELSFDDFIHFLDDAVFHNLIAPSTSVNSVDFDKIDEICWDLCKKKYTSDSTIKVTLNDDSWFKLWQIFNLFVETDITGKPRCPIGIPSSELELIALKFNEFTRRNVPVDKYSHSEATLRFPEFVNIFLTEFCKDLLTDLNNISAVLSVIRQLHEHFIEEVIKKGYLDKKQTIANLLDKKKRWLVLKPRQLLVYNSSDDKEPKETIPLSAMRIEARKQGFAIIASGETQEFTTPDNQFKSEWTNAIQQAKEDCEKVLTPQQAARQTRRAARQRKEEQRRADEAEQETQRQLQQTRDKQAEEERRRREQQLLETQQNAENQRLAAEKAAHELEVDRLNNEEHRRLMQQQFDEMMRNLAETEQLLQEERHLRELAEQLLQQERLAKEEEAEIRRMQASILAEEFEKSEELARMQRELEARLAEEQTEKEVWLREQQRAMRQHQEQINSLQAERLSNEKKLTEAAEKVKLMEEESRELQNQLAQTKNRRRPLSRQVHEQFKIITLRDPSFVFAAEAEYQVARNRVLMSQQSILTEEECTSPTVGV